MMSFGRPMCVCLPACGFVSGNRARTPDRASASRTPPFGRRGIPREMADSRVLATARHIHICLRVAVLRDSSHFRGFRPASARNKAAHGTSGRARREESALGLATVPAAMLPRLSLAIRVVIPRRRNTGSLPHSRLSAQFANRIPACHSAQRSVTLPASSPHVKPLQAIPTDTN